MNQMKIENIRSGLATALLARVDGLTAALADACADVVVELLIDGKEEAGFEVFAPLGQQQMEAS